MPVRVRYTCQTCGYTSPKWLGRCPDCGEWNSLVEEAPPEGGGRPRPVAAAEVLDVAQIPAEAEPRASTGLAEFDRVLGGGIVPGSLVLIGGEPGAGKSTLVSQVAARLAAGGARVLYVSGEESARQTRMRLERLGTLPAGLLLLAENNLEAIQQAIEAQRPALVVVDSIQAVYRPDIPSAPGSVGQVRECTGSLLTVAKGQGISIIIVGHVTKEGQLAGPRVLEHLVDTVLYFEGDRHHAYRILRATKNRFGSTNEIGVFEMGPHGLSEVSNPSALFLAERPAAAPGSAVVCALEGTRPLLLEVQALVAPTHFGMPRRTAAGVDYNRLVLLLAVLEKRAGLHLAMHDVYASVTGGLTVEDPAADLGVAVAVASAFRDRPVDQQVVVIGEVGLAGEVRAVRQVQQRVREAARLGFHRALVPRASGGEWPPGVEVVAVATVAEALALLLG
ncbi:MAG: DNA repair protein RadA [Armatimonadota bacterium]|nr:DNA repair protein RadA [Armatimonadota bacterium]MDR7427320.1 DNA repair protein RadA [Armatimonadota bacterium]MDR7463860.1 DNA repair protein RadA [Armatimonadota bacterium]MDR7469942.1 DNA repair protein RadA [Armatimonadota bacterium]MDR7474627.1 DNA repair protein RadA [Armatimonadota bacterium]